MTPPWTKMQYARNNIGDYPKEIERGGNKREGFRHEMCQENIEGDKLWESFSLNFFVVSINYRLLRYKILEIALNFFLLKYYK